MIHPITRAAIALMAASPCHGMAQTEPIDTVTITGGRPTSLPSHIPTTIEGITGAQIAATINATDSEDALKYLPSLLVRKRFIGDFNHAVLSTRASGTGNSARSMVFADGILLSNFLGNGAGFTPRWGLVAPDEIERVDVLYGPFSAAYAGNSVGAVVDYITRMPKKLEVHAKLAQAREDSGGIGRARSLSLGNRHGSLAWWLSLNRLDSSGQALGFGTRLVADGTAPVPSAVAVSGALLDRNPRGQPWWVLGDTTRYRTVQEQAKFKLSWTITPTVQANYTLGAWRNQTAGDVATYLRNAAGQPVYAGNVVIDGRQYNLNAPSLAFAPSGQAAAQSMHGLSIKSTTRAVFDWEIAASSFDYRKDILRAPTAPLPLAFDGGAGRITDMGGTGWHNLHLRGVWRPRRAAGSHVVDFGYQQDAYRLRTLVSSTGDWIGGAAGARFSAFNGETALQSLYAQDTWQLTRDWKTTAGLRFERWRAMDGEIGNAAHVLPVGVARDEQHWSPKLALAWQAAAAWSLKASLGRSVRMPTVGELFQGGIVGDQISNSDPHLKPERAWTAELSAERSSHAGQMRSTLFFERTSDALYSQALPQAPNVSTVQNVDGVRTRGLELSLQQQDAAIAGLDLTASLTYTHSLITANRNFPASVGKWQPRVPRWRASAVASYAVTPTISATLAGRYSGRQFGQLDNSDTYGFSYTGFSRFFVADARLRFKTGKHWSAAVGIDNLNNYRYWAFHPYAGRTVVAELKFDM